MRAMDYDVFLRRFPETYEELKGILMQIGYSNSNADDVLQYLIENGDLTRVSDERFDDMFDQYTGEPTELDFRFALSQPKNEQEKSYQISLGELDDDSRDVDLTLNQLVGGKELVENIQFSQSNKKYMVNFNLNLIQEKNIFQRGFQTVLSFFNDSTKQSESKVSSIRGGATSVYTWKSYEGLELITQPELESPLLKSYEELELINKPELEVVSPKIYEELELIEKQKLETHPFKSYEELELISQPSLNGLNFERDFNKIDLISKRNIYINDVKNYEIHTLGEKIELEGFSFKNYESFTLNTPQLQTIDSKVYEQDTVNVKQLQNKVTARMQESDIGVVRVSADELEQIPIIQVIQDAIEFLDDWINSKSDSRGRGYYSHSGLKQHFVPPIRLEAINQAVAKVGNVRNLAQLSNLMIEIFEEEMNESLTQSIMPGESDREHLDALRSEFGSLLD